MATSKLHGLLLLSIFCIFFLGTIPPFPENPNQAKLLISCLESFKQGLKCHQRGSEVHMSDMRNITQHFAEQPHDSQIQTSFAHDYSLDSLVSSSISIINPIFPHDYSLDSLVSPIYIYLKCRCGWARFLAWPLWRLSTGSSSGPRLLGCPDNPCALGMVMNPCIYIYIYM